MSIKFLDFFLSHARKKMVLDAGHIVEFESPRVLLQQDGSHFRALVNESNDRDTLYALASVDRLTAPNG
jgi:hypothetical protein